MDLTTVYRVAIQEDHSRKSLNRRVSFSSQSQVRLFHNRRGEHASSSSPSNELEFNGHSSDDAPSSPDPPPPHVNDENDYPGSSMRRRSSGRKSFAGSEAMDLTSTSFPPADESALVDEDMDLGEGSDMETTAAYASNLMRKRSLSLGIGAPQQREPLASLSTNPSQQPTEGPGDVSEEHSQSFMSETSMASEQSEPMEYTVPVGQSLKPAQEDEAWLALVKATHSGVAAENSDNEQEENGGDIDMDDAVARIMRARQSLNMAQEADGSIAMSEDSFENDPDLGNDTVDISRMMGRGFGRESLAIPRESMGYQESTMDESGIYGSAQPPIASTPRQSLAAMGLDLPDFLPESPAPLPQRRTSEPSDSRDPVFSLPPSDTTSVSGSKHPVSPTKGNKTLTKSPAKTFTAAFAPPASKPSPKKPTSSEQATLKRPRPSNNAAQDGDAERPSPAKRQALASRCNSTTSPASERPPSTSPTQERRPLDPNKKAPFQASTSASEKPEQKKPASSLRRPSGYFSRRKSLAVPSSLAPTPEVDENENMNIDSDVPNAIRTSPKKKAGIGLGRARASMSAATSSDAWKRFDRSAASISEGLGKGKEKEKELSQAEQLVQFQVSAQQDPGLSSPAPAVLDLSTYLNSEPAEDEEEPPSVNVDTATATEQWRDAIPPDGYSADELVCAFSFLRGISSLMYFF